MLSLPYQFDTAATWATIVKLFFIIAGVYATMVVSALLEGQFGAGIFMLLFAVLLWWTLVRRVRDKFVMGARGCLSAAEVITQPVKAWRYSLRVPVGRFPISQFSEITVMEYGMSPGHTSSLSEQRRCSVSLAGPNGTPSIELLFGSSTHADTFAHELGEVLKLPVRAIAAPGLHVFTRTLA